MAILTTKKGLYQPKLGQKIPAIHETLEELRERMLKEVKDKSMKIKIENDPKKWAEQMPEEIFDPSNDKSNPMNHGWRKNDKE